MKTGWFDPTPHRGAGYSLSRQALDRLDNEVSLRRLEAKRKRSASADVRAELARDGALRFRIFARDNYTCQHCRATGERVELTVDHIRPVVRGGTNSESNLQTLCRSCNSRKGARF